MHKILFYQRLYFLTVFILSIFLIACSKDYNEKQGILIKDKGFLILNNGQMGVANSSLSFYNPLKKEIINDVFYKANGIPLGDIAQSIYEGDDSYFILVTNSRKIVQVHKNTFKQIKSISADYIIEPRYMTKANSKFYVSNYKGKSILVFDKNMNLIKKISTRSPNGKEYSPNFIVQVKDKIFAACDYEDKTILVINTNTDTQEKAIEVGISPGDMVIDKDSNLWVLCSGGYEGNPIGSESPSIYKINTTTYEVEQKIILSNISMPSNLKINGSLDSLYFYGFKAKAIMQMPIYATSSDQITKFMSIKNIAAIGAIFIDNSDIYITDAKDYVNKGSLHRLDKNGATIDVKDVGVAPSFILIKN